MGEPLWPGVVVGCKVNDPEMELRCSPGAPADCWVVRCGIFSGLEGAQNRSA
jgi:hypothetical protein